VKLLLTNKHDTSIGPIFSILIFAHTSRRHTHQNTLISHHLSTYEHEMGTKNNILETEKRAKEPRHTGN